MEKIVRFYAEDDGVFHPKSSLVVDRKTGITYLILRNMFGTGITPLLDIDGKPVITKTEGIPRK